MDKQRIVFLDIDGPIINTPMFFLAMDCSIGRSVLNTQAIAYVQRLCDIAKAKVVFNTMHNTHDIADPLTGDIRTIRTDMIKWGLKPEVIHSDWMTEFPGFTQDRMVGIKRWIDSKDYEVDWVCFDDVNFTNDNRLVLIDFDRGIDNNAYRKAAKLWGFRQEPLIL